MKFFTDENISISVVEFLRKKGFDVKDAKEELLHGCSDKDIFELAKKESRIILTHDKDFVEIVNNYGLDFEGIILIRCKKQNPANVSKSLDNLLNTNMINKLKNNLFILNEEQLIIIKKS